MGHVEVRPYVKSEDADVIDWFVGHGWNIRPSTALPPCGVVCTFESEPIAAGWVYISECGTMAQMAWLVTKPCLLPRVAYLGLTNVISALEEIACSRGVRFVSFYAGGKGMLNMFMRCGYSLGDENVSQAIKVAGDPCGQAGK